MGNANRSKLKYVHRSGSQTFVARQEQLNCDRIELYKQAYCGEKGWAHEEAESRYEKMMTLKANSSTEEGQTALTDHQICGQVLGTRSSYVPGYGRGPKNTPRRHLTASSNYFEEKLKQNEEKLDATLVELHDTKAELHDTKAKLAAMEKKVKLLLQHVFPEEQSSND